MLEYLKLAQMMYIFEGHTLFCHAGVNQDSIGAVPNQKDRRPSVAQWCRELNEWARKEIQDFIQEPRPQRFRNSRKRVAGDIIDYCTRGGNRDGLHESGTVVCSQTWVKPNSLQPLPLGDGVEEYLGRSGIRVMAHGHKPHGDSPVVIRGSHKSTPVDYVCADTSYSDSGHKSSWGTDNRGIAVSECLFYPEGRVEVGYMNYEKLLLSWFAGHFPFPRAVGWFFSVDALSVSNLL